MAAIPEPPQALSDGTISLRLTAERDIPEILIAYQDDPQLHVRLGEERPPSGAQLGQRQDYAAQARTSGTQVTLTIVPASADVCVGQVYAMGFDAEQARAELGMWLVPHVRGRGYAPRALRLASAWLFNVCGLRQLQLLTDPDNQPMLAAARTAGFHPDGTYREDECERGGRVELTILSLAAAERTR